MTIVVGGVGELYQGDLDVGRLAAERLKSAALGPTVLVEDYHYGAIAVAQHLQDVAPDALVLVGAVQRGRRPGTIERHRIRGPAHPGSQVQAAIQDAGTGYVGIDLIITVASAFGVLPSRAVAIEMEPLLTGPREDVSREAAGFLDQIVGIVSEEVRRIPVLGIADETRDLCEEERLGPSQALETMRELLRELAGLDEEGRWGATFSLKERLRQEISQGRTSEGMSRLDWALWWALLEELDRLQTQDVARV